MLRRDGVPWQVKQVGCFRAVYQQLEKKQSNKPFLIYIDGKVFVMWTGAPGLNPQQRQRQIGWLKKASIPSRHDRQNSLVEFHQSI